MHTPAINLHSRWTRAGSRSHGWQAGLLAALGWLSLSGGIPAVAAEEQAEPDFRRIGATATVVEGSTGLPFAARVDTGATSCSIHCERMEIEDAASNPQENVGKPIRFMVKNGEGQAEWIESRIADHVLVRTSERTDDRYKVPLDLRFEDVEKKVLVTLNDRKGMNYPVLLGRNFLHGDFVVDVALDGDAP